MSIRTVTFATVTQGDTFETQRQKINKLNTDLADLDDKISGGRTLAWVNFFGSIIDGSSNCTMRGSFNVSSVTRLADDKYQINFTTALDHDQYSVTGSGVPNVSNPSNNVHCIVTELWTDRPNTTANSAVLKTISGVQIKISRPNFTSGTDGFNSVVITG